MLGHLGDLPDEQALLDPATLDEMHRPALGADQLGTLAVGQRMDLAFFDDSTPGAPAFGHDGDTNVFHTAMRMFPDSDAGIFVTFNGNGRDAVDTLELRTTVLQGFADRYLREGDGTASAAAPVGDPRPRPTSPAPGSPPVPRSRTPARCSPSAARPRSSRAPTAPSR